MNISFPKRHLKSLFLLVFLWIVMSPNAIAQWGTSYIFGFDLQDSITGLNTLVQYEFIKSKSHKNSFTIKSKNAKYVISGEQNIKFGFNKGVIEMEYFTNRRFVLLEFKIKRVTKDGEATMKVTLDQLRELDYISLNWDTTPIWADLSFGRDLNYYNYDLPSGTENWRDVTCLVTKDCAPDWYITDLGKTYLKKQEKLKVERIKFKLNQQFDSLINAHFMPGVFDKVFVLDCKEGYYNRAYKTNCHIKDDSTLYAIQRTYILADSASNPMFKLVAFSSLYKPRAYFVNHKLQARKHSLSEFNFLSNEEIMAEAKKQYPNFNFAPPYNGKAALSLVYLASPPSDRMPFEVERPIPRGNSNGELENWTGTFAYMIASNKTGKSEMIQCHKFLFFYAYKPIYITQTVHCTSLIDE